MTTTQPGSSSGNPTETAGGVGETNTQTVSYDTYTKTLGEAKAAKTKLNEALEKLAHFETNEKSANEKKLLDEKNFAEVIENLKREKAELTDEVQTHKRDKTDFRKVNAAIGLLTEKGIALEPKYLGLLNLNDIQVSDSGEVDLTSLAKVVSDFQTDHPRLVVPLGKLPPNGKTGGDGGLKKISMEEYSRLSNADKVTAIKEKRVEGQPGT